MTATGGIYYSTTDKTRGWWVGTVPTSAGFRVVKILRDGQRDASLTRIMEAAQSADPSVRWVLPGSSTGDSSTGGLGRHASPQAWRRLRNALGPGEARDIAADIAAVAGCSADDVRHALEAVPWTRYRQL